MAGTQEDAEGWTADSILFKQCSLRTVVTASIPFFFLFFSQLLFLSLPFCFLKESQGRQKKTFFLGAEQRLKDWHDKEAIRRDAQRVGMKGGAEHRVCCGCVRMC